ncbi:MAG: glycosyltransferase [Leptospiraceae bacterium]|nr:glycosyltransferase [Leptospiraceae bacterium]
MKVAVVHDWLTGMRGGEVVLEAILRLVPNADLFTLMYNPGTVSDLIANRKIHTSFIDRLPFKSKRYRHYLPLFPLAIEQFDFHGYDLIISSSHCVARGVIPPPGVKHLSYFHSPMRYVWDMYAEYFPRRGLLNRTVIPFFAHYLRMWDVSTRDRVDQYTCNSAFVAERIRLYYGKQARVIPPPCLDKVPDRIPAAPDERENFYLIVSAFVPYKRIDLAVEAFRGLPDRRLVVVGDGPEAGRLRKLAPENVSFPGRVSRNEILRLYSRARGLLFPGVEDFGIVPVEAQSYGCPVIAFGRGGSLETVVDGRTGVFFKAQTVDAIQDAVLRNEEIRYRASDFRLSVARFTSDNFKKAMRTEIQKIMSTQTGKKKGR